MIVLRMVFLLLAAGSCCASPVQAQSKPAQKSNPSPITFIELGSVKCIPCKKMQPVMKAVEEKYGGRVKVVFYDVWTEQHKGYAKQYGIRLIPTQIFLDGDGKELFRHEGYFPESEIQKLLAKHGLKPGTRE